MTTIHAMRTLDKAYAGSYYFIAGAGGDLQEWVDGYEKELEGIGKPKRWYQTTGADVNRFAGENGDPFADDCVCLLFPLDGLLLGRLAVFKLNMQDRWFDDVIDNMRRQA